MIEIVIGFASGILSGMGIGGGTILIPALIFFSIVSGQAAQQTAQGINLVFFIPTAIAALVLHIKNKKILFKAAVPMIIAGAAGAVGGSLLASVIEGGLLRRAFGLFILVVGIYEFFKKTE
ncbi:MAG: sulfite exporter TauE/SafE family protein [Clostridiales bacterium]|nr:sulfite exporter TauE/SafE family protein [Clostridiales bacterium]